MTTADRKLIDESIQKYGDDFWNNPNEDGEEPSYPNNLNRSNRIWIILDLLNILEKDNLDLKVVRKK